MRNRNIWQPGKFVYRRNGFRASLDEKEVGIGSRLYTNLTAKKFSTYLPEFAQGNLIDLGCGNVPLFAAYCDYVDEIICTDWEKNIHIDFVSDLTRILPIQSASLDTVILSDVLEHIANPDQLWREIACILKPKGKLLLSVPFYYGLHESPHDYYRYTGHALRRFAESSGFDVVVLEPLGGSPEILADLLAKHFAAVPVLGKPMAAAIQSITLAFVQRGLGKLISKKTSPFFPLGYFLVAEKIP